MEKCSALNVDKNNKEFVKLGKSVTVGLGYATQVGTIMNTAVGIMQAEEVGVTKKTMVGKSYSINVGEEFKITVGKASLVMKSDGSIIITGSTITSQSERENKVIGRDVLINPPGAMPAISIDTNRTVAPNPGSSPAYHPPPPLSVLSAGDNYQPEHKQAIIEALSEQKNQLEDARASLSEGNWQTSGRARFNKYFGNIGNTQTVEIARQEKIKQLDRMIELNKEISLDPFKYFQTPRVTDRLSGHSTNDLNLGAYVTSNDTTHTIKTGNAFFNKVLKKSDGTSYNFGPQTKEERARVLSHEMSHFDDIYQAKGTNCKVYGSVDRFDDSARFGRYHGGNEIYGDVASKTLSQLNPKKALNHADTFSYFVSQQGSAF